jgi:hypothetical protein
LIEKHECEEIEAEEAQGYKGKREGKRIQRMIMPF